MAKWQPLPIAGGAYTDDVTPWTAQDRLNYMVVNAERNGTRSPVKVQQCPGAAVFTVLPAGAPIRGLHNAEGLLLAVCGTKLYTIDANGVPTERGTIPGVGRVSIAHNQVTGGNEVAIANGLSGYVYNTKTTTLSQITDTGFIGAKVFDFIDGYMLGVEPAGRFWFHSNLADANDYNTLDRAEAEAQPDKIVTARASHREWTVFGERSTEFYRNTGAATGTFQRVDGTELEIGCPSTFGVAKLDNTLFFIGHDGCGYVLQGYQPIRITTHAIEQAWSRCDLSQAYCYTFEDQGHKVWYVTFTDGQTWGYDVASQEWHRRASQGLDFWRMSDLVRWNGRWVAGDYSNGKLYFLDWNLSNEAGAEMERRMRLHVIHDNGNRLIANALKLEFDTGKTGESDWMHTLSVSGDIPDGIVDDPVSGAYTATGGVGPYTYAVSSGSLPPGVTLSTDGTYSGDFTTAGSYSWTVQATDAEGTQGTVADTAEVVAAPLFVTFSPVRLQNGVLSEMRRVLTLEVGANSSSALTAIKNSGKWYVEFEVLALGLVANSIKLIAWTRDDTLTPEFDNYAGETDACEFMGDGSYSVPGAITTTGGAVFNTVGDVFAIAYDASTRQVWVRDDVGWVGGGNPATGTSPTATLATGTGNVTVAIAFNYSVDFAQSVRMNAGQGAAVYTIPTGFSWLTA